MKVVLIVFLAIACLNYPLDSAAYPAASAADDEACQKLNKRILDTIELPASTAFSNEKYMEALSLYRGGLAQWSSAVFKTSPNKDIQATKVAALKKDISRVLRRMGKFDEAAETLLSSINENWVGEFSSNYQTYINAGEIYAEGRLFEKALSSYRKVA